MIKRFGRNRNRVLFTRRRFVATAGAVTAAVSTGVVASPDLTNDAPRVSETDPTAKALNYVHDARTVDAAKRFSDRYCHNCALFSGTSDDESARCSVFPGKVVAGKGWCSVWAPRQTG